MKNSVVIAIDLGGTKISGAIFNDSGQMLYQQKVFLENLEGQAVGDLMLQLIDQIIQKSKRLTADARAVGIAVPGIYHKDKGSVWAPNIPGWDNYPLYRQVTESLGNGIQVVIDSDRACYILGETWQGTAKGSKHAIFLAVGTGIGAGIMVDGTIIRGYRDIAGAIGWMALTDHLSPGYEQHGCFEHHASGNGIAHQANQAYHQLGMADTRTAYDVFKAYAEGDQVAKKVLEEAIGFWGKAVANLVSLFNPEKIIFGGGVFGPGTEFLDDIHAEACKWAQPISMKQVQLFPTALGDQAGLFGAAYLANNYLKTDHE